MTLIDQDGREHPDPHPTLTWVLRRTCGCVSAASILDYDRDRAWDELAGDLSLERLAGGYTLERMPHGEFQELPLAICDCTHVNAPSALDHPHAMGAAVSVEPTTYTVVVAGLAADRHRYYAINVVKAGDAWMVRQGEYSYLGPDGEWSMKSSDDGWWEAHRYPLDRALELARAAAPGMYCGELSAVEAAERWPA